MQPHAPFAQRRPHFRSGDRLSLPLTTRLSRDFLSSSRPASACHCGDSGRRLRHGALSRGSDTKGHTITVARITEISSVSKKSFQDAVVQGVKRANKTLKNLKGAWVKDQEVTIDKGKVTGYKVVLKVTFILTD